MLFIELLLLAVGFVLLVKGADAFVEGASGIADKFGIPQLVIGLTIVAMGTSAPEAAVSITAALKGNADITVGNIVGSNILNIFIILGLASAITTIAVANTNVISLDSKIGGSTRLCTKFSPLIMMIVEKNSCVMQGKFYKNQ